MYQAYSIFGKIDAVINCVGIFSIDPTTIRISINRFKTVPRGFFANVLGSVYISFYYTLLKEEGEGVILNVSPMITTNELEKLSVYFSRWVYNNSISTSMFEVLVMKEIRFLSISPSSMSTLMLNIPYESEIEVRKALIMDSVIKRYHNYKEFVDLAIYALNNSKINGVELELGNENYSRPPTVAKI